MKKILIVCLLLAVLTVSVSGCVKRVDISSLEKDRVDQEIAGNKGFISGDVPPVDEPKQRDKKRRVYQVVIDVPPYSNWKNFRSEPTVDEELWGNRGYIYGGPQSVAPEEQTMESGSDEETAIMLPDEGTSEDSEQVVDEPKILVPVVIPQDEVSYSTYVVQKGDTLQKVSKKSYGTTKKWKKIFDFNAGVLKNPNKIYPGQKIKIPQL